MSVETNVMCVTCGQRSAFSFGHRDVRVCRECEVARHTAVSLPFDMQAFIAGSEWRTARSGDHQWTLRDLATPDAHRSSCADHQSFEAAVIYIREHGRASRWAGREYTYWFDLGSGLRYWSMGADPRVTTIINRSEARAEVLPR